GKTWRFIGNLPVAQFYHIAVDNEFPYNVYGGMQDNGSWRGPAYVWRSQGIRNSYWQEISFGDGFDVVPDRDDSRYGWSMSQQGYVSRYDWQTGNNYGVRPTHPDPDIKLRFNWNSAINIDPFDNSTIYFGSQFVHKSTDKGETWTVISPDLSTNDPEKQKQSESGGLTMDATGAENHCTVLVIEPSPLEKDMLWAGTDDGRVHYTMDGGNNWTEVTKSIKGLPEGSWITQIKASHKNKGEALLIANDYRRFNYEPYAYRTKNYGKTWQRIVDGSDVQSYTLSIVEDVVEPNLMFLGTDDGLYISINAGEKWTKWTEGFPTTSVKDLVIQPREDDLVIGTFGRAAWVLDDIRPLREMAKNNSVMKSNIKLFDPPTAYQAAYQQPTGSRFGGDAMYHGENRGGGARFTYLFNKKEQSDTEALEVDGNKDDDKTDEASSTTTDPATASASKKEKEDKKVKWDSLTLKLYDGDRLIRTLKRKAPKENGLHKWTWYMNEAGVNYPSRTIRKRNREPGGVSVKPGTYRAVLHYGDLKSETNIKVESDPRLNVSQKNTNEVYATLKQLEKLQQTAADAVKQLVESKTIAEDYKKELSKLDKDRFKDQIKLSKETVKTIDSLINKYIGKVDKRQGITRNPEVTPMQRLGLARSYVNNSQTGLTSTETTLIEHAKNALDKIFGETNNFFNTTWKDYQTQMSQLQINPFKEVKIFSTD
ncbi:WD40/YVTN/BNR-like repeat-containing protein, partial [Winogradskyella sp.]|uniref:WD40/YVTN/BNR-like repeat-containing protein n=1 Tax=Winogradskyella sp. TaxID=1883156 RepID=UPI00345C85B0